MDFASRIYHGADGRIYVSDGADHPRTLYQVPDSPTLDRLMRETCWAGTQMTLAFVTGLAILTLLRLADLHIALALPLVLLVGFMVWIGRRGLSAAHESCVCVKAKESELVLKRTPEVARLKAIPFVRIAAIVILAAAFYCSVINYGPSVFGISERLVGPLQALFSLLAIGALRVTFAGVQCAKARSLDLAFENREARS